MSVEPVLVGVIGGSGFYELLPDGQEIVVDTPYGPHAGPITVGTLSGQHVAFLPRHGANHDFVAHRVPYRANIWALHSLGVRSIIAPCSVGSLQHDIHPGQMVVVDQLVDRTHGRVDTYHDVGGPIEEPGSAPPVHHQTFADPYDADLRAVIIRAGGRLGIDVRDGGTMVVINGPRFSTRAESRWFAQMGWHIVNMTGCPEAVLAAELGIRYASVALVTDYDAGNDRATAVTMDDVFAVVRANIARVRELITAAIADRGGRRVDEHLDRASRTDRTRACHRGAATVAQGLRVRRLRRRVDACRVDHRDQRHARSSAAALASRGDAGRSTVRRPKSGRRLGLAVRPWTGRRRTGCRSSCRRCLVRLVPSSPNPHDRRDLFGGCDRVRAHAGADRRHGRGAERRATPDGVPGKSAQGTTRRRVRADVPRHDQSLLGARARSPTGLHPRAEVHGPHRSRWAMARRTALRALYRGVGRRSADNRVGRRRRRVAAPLRAVPRVGALCPVAGDLGRLLYTAVGAVGVAVFAVGLRRRSWQAASAGLAGGLLLGSLMYLTYLGVVFALVPVPFVVAAAIRRRAGTWPALAGAVVGVSTVVLGFLLAGFWWIDGARQTRTQYWLGTAQFRTWGYFKYANIAVLLVAIGPAAIVGLMRLRDRRMWLLTGGGLAAVAASHFSQYTRGEVERIWLLFFPWLAIAAGSLAARGSRRSATAWVGLQAACAIGLQAALVSKW